MHSVPSVALIGSRLPNLFVLCVRSTSTLVLKNGNFRISISFAVVVVVVVVVVVWICIYFAASRPKGNQEIYHRLDCNCTDQQNKNYEASFIIYI